MKNFFLAIICFLLVPFSSGAQEKKPTLMILPSDNWCSQRYFTTSFEDQGRTIRVPDYQRAFQEDTEIGFTISQIGQILTDLGYSIKDSEQELKNIAIRQVEDENTFSHQRGAAIVESPLDIIKRTSKSDIIIQIGWQVNKESNGKSVSFTLEAFDAYTSKRIATATGISKASTDIVPRIIASAVKKQIKPFDAQLSSYFSNLSVQGREVLLTVRCWDDWEMNLETEFEGTELLDSIQEWMTGNAVGGSFNLSDATEDMARFEQVRIPLFNKEGVAIDARYFANELRKHLQKAPYGITAKVLTRGLGEAVLVLGEK